MEHILHLNSSIWLWCVCNGYYPHSLAPSTGQEYRRYAESRGGIPSVRRLQWFLIPITIITRLPQCSELANQRTLLWQVTNKRHKRNILRLGSIMGHFRLASPTETSAHKTSVSRKIRTNNKKVRVKWLQNPSLSTDSLYFELITHRFRPGQDNLNSAMRTEEY